MNPVDAQLFVLEGEGQIKWDAELDLDRICRTTELVQNAKGENLGYFVTTILKDQQHDPIHSQSVFIPFDR